MLGLIVILSSGEKTFWESIILDNFRKSVLIFVPINLSNAHPYDGSFLSMHTNHKPDPYQKVTDNSRNSVSKRFLFQNL